MNSATLIVICELLMVTSGLASLNREREREREKVKSLTLYKDVRTFPEQL